MPDPVSADIQLLSDILKWTLGSIFAFLTTAFSTLALLGKWAAARLMSDDTGANGKPKGVLVRMHHDALSEIRRCTEAVAKLSPEAYQSDLDIITQKLDQLAALDKQHAAEIAELKHLIQEAFRDMKQGSHV